MNKYHKIYNLRKINPETKKLTKEFYLPEFELLKDNLWYAKEKIDGTNIRLCWYGDRIEIKGKTEKSDIPKDLLNNLYKMCENRIKLFKEVFGDKEVCIYGEGYGAKIQKGGGLYRKDQGFILFDVMIEGYWLSWDNALSVASSLKLKTVPLIISSSLLDIEKHVINGFNSQVSEKTKQAEGVIALPCGEFMNRHGDRIIVKIKTERYK